jgi:hypothetical protein
LFQAAQKAKNRLSAAQNRHSLRVPDDESDVFTAPNHPRRRPTINRKRKSSDITEDRTDHGARSREDTKKKEAVATDIGEKQ